MNRILFAILIIIASCGFAVLGLIIAMEPGLVIGFLIPTVFLVAYNYEPEDKKVKKADIETILRMLSEQAESIEKKSE